MNRVQTFIGHMLGKMSRWLFSWALVIGASATAWFRFSSGHFPGGAEWGLILTIAVVAGLLGLVSALAWELTHIGQIMQFLRTRRSQGIADTQEMPAQQVDHRR